MLVFQLPAEAMTEPQSAFSLPRSPLRSPPDAESHQGVTSPSPGSHATRTELSLQEFQAEHSYGEEAPLPDKPGTGSSFQAQWSPSLSPSVHPVPPDPPSAPGDKNPPAPSSAAPATKFCRDTLGGEGNLPSIPELCLYLPGSFPAPSPNILHVTHLQCGSQDDSVCVVTRPCLPGLGGRLPRVCSSPAKEASLSPAGPPPSPSRACPPPHWCSVLLPGFLPTTFRNARRWA